MDDRAPAPGSVPAWAGAPAKRPVLKYSELGDMHADSTVQLLKVRRAESPIWLRR
jgi:hypothetical protein